MSRGIKRHIIKLYTRDLGYSLYSGNPHLGFEMQDLDIESRYVPRSYINAQNKLDSFLESRNLAWSMCFRHDPQEECPIVAYGTYVELANQPRVPGVVFIHGMQLDKSETLYACVEAVVACLSPTRIRPLMERISNVALNRISTPEFLKSISKAIENLMNLNHPPAELGAFVAPSIKSIAHDCAGGSAVAWLAMASLLENASPPWEVYDSVDRSGVIETVLYPSTDGKSMSALQILRRSKKQLFDGGYISSMPQSDVPQKAHERIANSKAQDTHAKPFHSVEEKRQERLLSEVDHEITSTEYRSPQAAAAKQALEKPLGKDTYIPNKESNPLSLKARLISNRSLFIFSISIIVGFSLLIIYYSKQVNLLKSLTEQQNILVKDFRTFTEDLKRQSIKLSSGPPEPRLSTPTDTTASKNDLITRMFHNDPAMRASAMNSLSNLLKTDEGIIINLIEYARLHNTESDKIGLYQTLKFLQANPQETKNNSDEIIRLLDEINNNLGPSGLAVAADLRQRLRN